MCFSGGRLATFAMSSVFDMPSSVEIAGTSGIITVSILSLSNARAIGTGESPFKNESTRMKHELMFVFVQQQRVEERARHGARERKREKHFN